MISGPKEDLDATTPEVPRAAHVGPNPVAPDPVAVARDANGSSGDNVSPPRLRATEHVAVSDEVSPHHTVRADGNAAAHDHIARTRARSTGRRRDCSPDRRAVTADDDLPAAEGCPSGGIGPEIVALDEVSRPFEQDRGSGA